ncbi:hypothetical protein BDY19DRAFT_990877 [Irpex rosettiformis]|uniref:Uncharacterized protein n=1 Tax=Irpex rosettiformis TaxID=378272 RepID=A0ACB8UDW7_9APHY|nr:hypothetical protein BDY19DRAFT_990877 [Irpex rosettiformis]
MVLSSLYNKPNHVYELQKLVQASHEPTYLRLPRSRLYVGTYYTLFCVGMTGVVYGAYNLIKGKKTE